MAEVSLAVKYRPTKFEDVTEQGSTKTILTQQLRSGAVKNAYLFCGGAGTGKTTCARIFANEINKGQGEPTELDAASNNSVDDVRLIIQQSKTQSLDSEYRIFIIDECHALSNNAWQAFLKLLEEPPKKSIFIFCTTDPQKIPKTILSRVQRFDFQRISTEGIADRLLEIVIRENSQDYNDPDLRDIGNIRHDKDAINYIAKIADGGMRDAITMLDKCLAYSTELTVENVLKALGAVNYGTFFDLTDAITADNTANVVSIVERVYSEGKDLKQFVKDYLSFLLDINKYDILHSFDYLKLPITYQEELGKRAVDFFRVSQGLLPTVVKLSSDLKWETQPKTLIEAVLLGFIWEKYLK